MNNPNMGPDRIIYLALPSYDGTMNNDLAIALQNALVHTPGTAFITRRHNSSFLTKCFNSAWCAALNQKQQQQVPLTHFLMVHADLAPMQPDWVQILLDVMSETKADVVSVASPIKDDRGVTSIARDTHEFAPQRYTMKEINEGPANFEAELINTGMMLVDFTKDWIWDINPPFAVYDRIVDDPKEGKIALALSEDWYFSRVARTQYNAKLVCTRKVGLIHFGKRGYRNDEIWGWDIDLQNIVHVLNKKEKEELTNLIDKKEDIDQSTKDSDARLIDNTDRNRLRPGFAVPANRDKLKGIPKKEDIVSELTKKKKRTYKKNKN